MLMCPGCKSEYVSGVKVCPECGLELINVDLVVCDNCEEEIDSNFKYCLHCGFILKKSKSDISDECENHPGKNAIGICVICGKPVCAECAKISNKRIFCEKDEHLQIYGDYVLIKTFSTEYEAQMIKSLIEMAGIECVLFSQKDHVFFSNIGDTAIVNLMVPKEYANKAFELIDELNKTKGDDLNYDETK
ncbi:MAG TPA: zinc ribbon domain-containing protein [Ignavibacteria bacterium]|jgi:hypothetical protein